MTDLHITAALLDPYRTPINLENQIEAFRGHLANYVTVIDCNAIPSKHYGRIMENFSI